MSFRHFINENGKRVDGRRRQNCYKCNPIGERKFWEGKEVGSRPSRNEKQERVCKVCSKPFAHRARNLECTTCRNKRIRQERKQKAYAKFDNKCKVCGYDKCINALDLHHLNENEKLFTFAGSWGRSWETISKELEKCVLLCCRCHREVHDGYIEL